MHNFGRSTIVVLMLALASGVSGCAVRFPQMPFGRSDTVPPETSQGQPAASAETLPRPPATGGQQPPHSGTPLPTLTRPERQAENSFTSSVKKAARSVGDALTIKPKVVKAHDPTSLDSQPGPVGPDLYISAAQLTENRGDFETARTHYEKALEIDQDCLPALIGLSRLHHRLGQMDRAAQYSHRAVQAHPQNAVARNDLGLCYARQRQFQTAIESFTQAVQLQPDSKLYRNNLAAALVLAGRNNEALMHLSQAHGAAIANYNLGYLLYKQGKGAESREYFQRALQADPELRPAAQMLTRLQSQERTPLVQQPEANRRRDSGLTLPQQNPSPNGSDPGPPPVHDEIFVQSRRLPPVADDTQPVPAPVAPPVAGQYSSPPLGEEPAAPNDRDSTWPELPGSDGAGTQEPSQNFAPVLTPEEAARQRSTEPTSRRRVPQEANSQETETASEFDRLPADVNRLELSPSPPPMNDTMRAPVADESSQSGRASRFQSDAPQGPETPRLPATMEPEKKPWWEQDLNTLETDPEDTPSEAPAVRRTTPSGSSQLRFPAVDPRRGEAKRLDAPSVPPQPSNSPTPSSRQQPNELWPVTPAIES